MCAQAWVCVQDFFTFVHSQTYLKIIIHKLVATSHAQMRSSSISHLHSSWTQIKATIPIWRYYTSTTAMFLSPQTTIAINTIVSHVTTYWRPTKKEVTPQSVTSGQLANENRKPYSSSDEHLGFWRPPGSNLVASRLSFIPCHNNWRNYWLYQRTLNCELVSTY